MQYDHNLVIDATQIDKVKVGDYGVFGFYPLSLKKSVESNSEKAKGIVTKVISGTNWFLEKNNNPHNRYAFFYPLPNPKELKDEW